MFYFKKTPSILLGIYCTVAKASNTVYKKLVVCIWEKCISIVKPFLAMQPNVEKTVTHLSNSPRISAFLEQLNSCQWSSLKQNQLMKV